MSSNPVTADDMDAQNVVAWLHQVGLAGPAYLLLQGMRPLSFLGGQGLLFLQPFLPRERWRLAAGRFAGLIEDRSRLDTLLNLLEAHLRSDKSAPEKED